MDTVDDDAWRAGWELKVFGYIAMCRAFFARMRERGHGVIVNDVGNSGENPDFDYIAGACGNSSLMTLSRALGGRSLDHGIRVVAVNPGPVDTGRMETMLRQRAGAVLGDEERWGELLARFPGGRAATAGEVADLIVFCASRARRLPLRLRGHPRRRDHVAPLRGLTPIRSASRPSTQSPSAWPICDPERGPARGPGTCYQIDILSAARTGWEGREPPARAIALLV